ncbi:MAG: EsaB/YukD family protein [Butyrivibrio sp.]|nr:EsaB/YukD family protein [Acetatifactor muris]MCM1558517.1 EsaB/YukD family protein [Butyrivibrio sp.]
MKNSILLEVCLPAEERSFDVRIPKQMKVAQALGMLVEFLKRQDEEYIPTDESVLCDRESGRALDSNLCIGEAGLHSGSGVMVI